MTKQTVSEEFRDIVKEYFYNGTTLCFFIKDFNQLKKLEFSLNYLNIHFFVRKNSLFELIELEKNKKLTENQIECKFPIFVYIEHNFSVDDKGVRFCNFQYSNYYVFVKGMITFDLEDNCVIKKVKFPEDPFIDSYVNLKGE